MKPSLLKRGPMRRRLRILQRRREAMLLDLGALVLEMHRHGRFLPDGLQRRAAETVGTDAQLRALSRSLEAGDGTPDLVAAGVAGNCDRCGALHTLGSAFCSQCGNELDPGGILPRKAALGRDPELTGGAPIPRRTVPAAPVAPANGGAAEETAPATELIEEPDVEPAVGASSATATKESRLAAAPPGDGVSADDGDGEAEAEDGEPDAPALLPPSVRRARATRVRQRLDEPSRTSQPLPVGLLAGIAAGLLVIALGILLLSGGDGGGGEPERTADAPAQRQPEPPPPDEAPSPDKAASPPAALRPVEGLTATAYDPSGDDEEHDDEARLAVDGDGATAWPTEEYETATLPKDGVGLVLAPPRRVAARGLDLRTPTPGFDVTIYGAQGELPDAIDTGWTRIAAESEVARRGRIDLDSAGQRFSHYLIWITSVPGDGGKVEIAEARLLR